MSEACDYDDDEPEPDLVDLLARSIELAKRHLNAVPDLPKKKDTMPDSTPTLQEVARRLRETDEGLNVLRPLRPEGSLGWGPESLMLIRAALSIADWLDKIAADPDYKES